MNKYTTQWDSISKHKTPEWLQEAKLGIYTHWGPYSVSAYGDNGSWYPHDMYREDLDTYQFHRRTFGKQEEFGYKDFIPQFTAEKFDADEWAELFRKAGARFAGPVAEHHDGFSMWDSQVNHWNAANMGPKVDVVDAMAKAVRNNNMRYITTFHHAFNWFFFPTWNEKMDCSDPRYRDLYTGPHGVDPEAIIRFKESEHMANPLSENNFPDERAFAVFFRGAEGQHQRPNKWFLDRWLDKLKEVIDLYEPDLLWFDFCLGKIRDSYRREFLSYYYNKALGWGKEVDVLFKEMPTNNHNLPPLTGTPDLEVGGMDKLVPHLWVTDTSIDTSNGHNAGWSHVTHLGFKTGERLVHNLIDIVSKNGVMLLNVGPRADGTIPERAQHSLLDLGKWLEINGEGIYNTVPWITSGEGPTQNNSGGHFAEDSEPRFTPTDFRFTTKGRNIYAFCMGLAGDESLIKTLGILYPDEIEEITMLGLDGQTLSWKLDDDGLHVEVPRELPGNHAYTFRITCK